MNCDGKTRYYYSSGVRGDKWRSRACRAKFGIRRMTVVHRGKTVVDKLLCPVHRRAVRASWASVLNAEVTEHD